MLTQTTFQQKRPCLNVPVGGLMLVIMPTILTTHLLYSVLCNYYLGTFTV